ncbi:hypothetical protein F8154_08795 [Alkaliphilus pronyensis]|uniref:Uncharacterized protein n=1 Tax=Alkaliphilus pronyensis TaxID=1482732 RepID=A0A6I0F8T9_9FIRM|nr:hypothetical protein [Alkaliphilus pronyensis]KAB3534498.1 hypothetical protein F8154_08795 [Alkaliphilus pronyensis]
MKDLICIDRIERWTGLNPYHPDDIDYAYMTEELVEEIVKLVRVRVSRNSYLDEVLEFIKFYEKAHRQLLLGEVVTDIQKQRANEWAKDFRNNHGHWFHQDPAYDEFYRILNRGSW